MKRFLFSGLMVLLLVPTAFAELIIPESPITYVLDEAGVLSQATEDELNLKLEQFEADTSTQVVVVTMADLQNYPIEQVALAIGREWGVGQEEFDNGIVFLVAPAEHEARIEVGRGLEGIMPDSIAYAILDEIAIPYFKVGAYDEGVIEGTDYIVNVVANEDFDLSELNRSDDEGLLMTLIVFGIIFAWTVMSILSWNKSWWAGGIFGGLAGFVLTFSLLGLLIGAGLGLLLDYIASTYLYEYFKSVRKSSRGGRGGFGGGSSGGGGGFSGGGGGFSGGGASGSW